MSHIFQKIDTPESFIVLSFFHQKVSTVIFSKGGYKPFPDHNIVIILVSASVLAKTHSRMKSTKISFSSRLSDIGERLACVAGIWKGREREFWERESL